MSTLFSHFFQKINQISPLEADFTEVLDGIALKPKTLYFRGKMPENMVKVQKSSPTGESVRERPKSVAIVGSRHNTRYGQDVAYKLAYELARRGAIIVSGLAYGIDSVGHRAALDAGGRTVAVLGTPIDQIYPTAHVALAREIIEKDGAIISEYAPRTPDYLNAPLAPAEAGWDTVRWISYENEAAGRFPGHAPFRRRRLDPRTSFLARNRLISGLADIVVIVEAAERSGSLNTAAHAAEQGREVFAVPGNVNSPYSQGCNKLIAEGAIPYTAPSDVIRILFPEEFITDRRQRRAANLIGDSDVETKILTALAAGARTSEEIMTATYLPPEVASVALSLLEVKARVRSLSPDSWSLA